jgi:4,5-dihydroxyphthalate decarboxylase
MKLKALLGDYPNTRALKSGQVRPERAELDFADEKTVNKAFKRVVRDLEFDVAELAIATFLQAKAHGKPLVLLPAVVRGKFAHSTLQYNAERGELKPANLAGHRVGIRAYAQTTPLWVRGILQNEYGVDLDRVKWTTFEDPHVAEYREPATAERAAAGKKAREMLLEGELDAAILSEQRDAAEPRLKTLIPDAPAAAQAWYRKHGVVPINHMVCVKESLSKSDPAAVADIYRMLAESKKASGLPKAGEPDGFTFGVEACRKALEMAIRFCTQQRLLPRPLTVDELFDDTTRQLGR